MTHQTWHNIQYKQTDTLGNTPPDGLGFSLNFPVTNPRTSLPDLDAIKFFTTEDEDGLSEKIGKDGYYYSDGLGPEGREDYLIVQRNTDNAFVADVNGVNITLKFSGAANNDIALTHEWPGKEPYVRHFKRQLAL